VLESFRRALCARCRAVFYVCRQCDRGQIYCNFKCRRLAVIVQKRRARARHQSTPEGRLDHRDRQRAFRARQRERPEPSVTDGGSGEIRVLVTSPLAAQAPAATTVATLVGPEVNVHVTQQETPKVSTSAQAGTVCCAFCHRKSLYIRHGYLQHHVRGGRYQALT
jgi:hypothetical protein